MYTVSKEQSLSTFLFSFSMIDSLVLFLSCESQSVEHIIDGFLKDKGSMEDHAFDVLNLELEIASYQILSDGEISDALTSVNRSSRHLSFTFTLYILPVAHCLLPAACCLLHVTCYLLPVTCCLLHVACCLWPLTCCLLVE